MGLPPQDVLVAGSSRTSVSGKFAALAGIAFEHHEMTGLVASDPVSPVVEGLLGHAR
jgi:hypothetical protein